MRSANASGLLSFGKISATGGSGELKNSAKNRRPESSSCFIMSDTLLDRGCGRNSRSPGSNASHTEMTLLHSLA
jgi:hypothetical protein